MRPAGHDQSTPTVADIRKLFEWSDLLDHEVLRPLSHIKPNWEIWWDQVGGCYELEDDSFAEALNILIGELTTTAAPKTYHASEDIIVARGLSRMDLAIQNENGRWIGADYATLLEAGSFHGVGLKELLVAAVGRICAAIRFGQRHFDEMEEGHRRMLSILLQIVLYYRSDDV